LSKPQCTTLPFLIDIRLVPTRRKEMPHFKHRESEPTFHWPES
jgi:hypothetical protein